MDTCERPECPYKLRKRKAAGVSTPDAPAHKVTLVSVTPGITSLRDAGASLKKLSEHIAADDGPALMTSIKKRGSLQIWQMEKFLTESTERQSEKCVMVLLEYGAYTRNSKAILRAARSGNSVMMSAMIDFGADIEVRAENGDSIYHMLVYAVVSGRTQDIRPCFQLLHRHSVATTTLVNEPNSKGLTPLFLALTKEPGNTELVSCLMEFGANPRQMLLLNIRRRRRGRWRWIRQYPNDNSLLHFAVNNYMCDVESEESLTLLSTLVNVCKLDVEHRNDEDLTPFLYAVYNNNMPAMMTLVELGANVHAFCEDWELGALGIWLKYHSTDISVGLWLLEQGLDVNIKQPNGMSFVGAFIEKVRMYHGNDKILYQVEILTKIIQKATPESLNYKSSTQPLYWTSLYGSVFFTKLLIEKGATVSAAAGLYTPISIAADYGYSEILRLLLCGLKVPVDINIWRYGIRKSIRSKRLSTFLMMMAVKFDYKILLREYQAAYQSSTAMNEAKCLVESFLSEPRALDSACRRCVWENLPPGEQRSELIQQLFLPKHLIEFLLLQNI